MSLGAGLNLPLAAAHRDYLGTKHFASLDGLRCLSITCVIALHAFISTLNIQAWGHHGVSMFFVISGFLITTLLLREQSRDGTISLKKFYTRRVLRIFPLYYAVLALYIVLVYTTQRGMPQGKMFFHNLPYFLTYTSNLFMNTSLPHTHFIHSWSLATEEQFYLVWPVVILLAGRKTLIPVFFMSTVALLQTIGWALVNNHIIDLGQTGNAAVGNIGPAICLGSLLAYALHSPKPFRWFYPVLGRKWSGVAFFALAALVIWRDLPDSCLYLAMVGIVGSVCIRESHPLRPLLTNRVVVYIGTISYGMYLMSQLCQKAVPMRLYYFNQYLYFFAAAGAMILVATISYYCYERPFLLLKNRLCPVEHKPHFEVTALAA